MISFGFPQYLQLVQVSPHQMNLGFGPQTFANRVIYAVGSSFSHQISRRTSSRCMTDFSLSAVMRSIGKVVREPTIFENFACRYQETKTYNFVRGRWSTIAFFVYDTILATRRVLEDGYILPSRHYCECIPYLCESMNRPSV